MRTPCAGFFISTLINWCFTKDEGGTQFQIQTEKKGWFIPTNVMILLYKYHLMEILCQAAALSSLMLGWDMQNCRSSRCEAWKQWQIVANEQDHEGMHEWINTWVSERLTDSVSLSGWLTDWLTERTNEQTNERTNKRRKEWMNESTSARMWLSDLDWNHFEPMAIALHNFSYFDKHRWLPMQAFVHWSC